MVVHFGEPVWDRDMVATGLAWSESARAAGVDTLSRAGTWWFCLETAVISCED